MTDQPTPERIAEIRRHWEREVDDKLFVYANTNGAPLERAIVRNQVRGFLIEEFMRLQSAVDASTAAQERLTQERNQWEVNSRENKMIAEENHRRAEHAEADLAALRAERDRYENAQCVTCGRDLDRPSVPTPETEER